MPNETKKTELAIVIPAKNEESRIAHLLDSLLVQDYPLIANTPIIVADAHSTDRTREMIMEYSPRLLVSVVNGGIPSVGRNAGARAANTEYVLFVDADIELRDTTIIRRALEESRRHGYTCVTARIRCANGTRMDKLMYSVGNLAVRLSKYFAPFATGMFMFFDKNRFDKLGGFDESVVLAEDYVLTRNLKPNEFKVLPQYFDTTNRRFVKIGHWKMIRIVLGSIFHTKSIEYFRRTGKEYFAK